MNESKKITKFVTLQSNVIIHIYYGDNYIDTESMTYKKFFELKCDEFCFCNPSKDTLTNRLDKLKKAGYDIYANDDINYNYMAVKSTETLKKELKELLMKNALKAERLIQIRARTAITKRKIEIINNVLKNN